MPEFFASSFAVAGVVAAAAPLVIHLLNRRRYRVVDWGAMDLLREAIARNRRILHLRDLLLLLLRTACVLLFALALAKPYLSATSAASDPNQPIHAVLVIDNSLSMGYQRLEGTLLDEAKKQIIDFIDRLPPGSHFSVIPACGSAQAWSNEVYRNPADARDAVSRIEIVDRSALFSAVVDEAAQACTLSPEVPSKRVVFVGDQQKLNWPSHSNEEGLKALADVQVVQIAPDEQRTNAWVADFRLQDELADIENPAIFVGVIRYTGTVPRTNVEVVLSIDGARVASQTVDLEPGQTRQVRFSQQIAAAVEPGEPTFVGASLSITADQLPADDVRYLMVPVVSATPVLFIDQLGANLEDPRRNRYGETFPLRRLLSPVRSRDESIRQMVHIRHLAMHQVERQHLEDCRLVVIAGVESPQSLTPLLREYVEQGGQLVVAAGGDFDSVAWTNRGWLNGAGILPAPLKPEPVGRLPDDSNAELKPFFLSPESMTDEQFSILDASKEEIDDLYRTPLFFKAVEAEVDSKILADLLQTDAARESDRRNRRDSEPSTDRSAAEVAATDNSAPTDEALRWLLWGREQQAIAGDESPEAIARRQQPQILARFSNGVPFLIERRIGRGDVLFIATGVQSSWNNLTRTNAVVIYDRLLRTMMLRTLPPRNFGTNERAIFAVAAADRRADFTLTRPDGSTEPLFVDASGVDQFSVALRNLTERGAYRLSASQIHESRSGASESANAARALQSNRLWQIDMAVNGPSEESDLSSIGEVELQQRLGSAAVRWVAKGEPIRLEGATVRGQEFWKWLMAAALVGLFFELVVLARSHSATASPPSLTTEAT